MFALSFFLCCAIVAIAVSRGQDIKYPTPGPTFDAKKYTTWQPLSVGESRRGSIFVPFQAEDGSDDFVSLIRLDLVGDSYSRGFAHGALLTKEIIDFSGPAFDEYIMGNFLNWDISKYPEPVQKILRVIEVKGKLAAPGAFKSAMKWVWESEEKYTPESIKQEIKGLSVGMCSTIGSTCDVSEWESKLQAINMFPELIRMACTAYGAWGPSTAPADNLIQLRALDLGGGPWNYTVVSVNRYSSRNPSQNAFVSVFYPGMIGAITGISQSGIGISEKVWEVSNSDRDMLPGSFDGLADVFALRHILQYSESKAAAENFLQTTQRTWGIWIGIGEYASKTFDLVGYQQSSAVVYNDTTISTMTSQPYIPSIAYVDKHTQPSGGDTTLPDALQDFYGHISLETTKTILKYHKSGDQHIASYDFGAKVMYLAVGRLNQDSQYGPEGGDLNSWKAYNRPYLRFELNDLWAGL